MKSPRLKDIPKVLKKGEKVYKEKLYDLGSLFTEGEIEQRIKKIKQGRVEDEKRIDKMETWEEFLAYKPERE